MPVDTIQTTRTCSSVKHICHIRSLSTRERCGTIYKTYFVPSGCVCFGSAELYSGMKEKQDSAVDHSV